MVVGAAGRPPASLPQSSRRAPAGTHRESTELHTWQCADGYDFLGLGTDPSGVDAIMDARFRRWLIRVLIGLGGVVGVLLVSPLLLVIVDAILTVDWGRLTEIGQSYTGVSAILSAVALVGVTLSIRLQAKQTALMQQQTVRELQFDMLRMAAADPALAPVTGAALPEGDESHEAFKLHVFQSQFFRYLEYGYLVGEYSDQNLENLLVRELFPVPSNRAWWSRVRTYWIPANSTGKKRRFIDVVERAYAATETRPSAE
ncbi:DUF6082 family protein [Pseudonocardia humida]|uniref:DUF4760 domain-containing protein n=1 Tax=Pseudonocardia humida TaxID=2800819 RepID=A0ABT0ZTH2_9PSEU|nr:DUF6082 family protein [Pseudonocardia humida]MCO1653990.1 hypothetical protein [Pseudonocardia humida]